MLGLVEPDESNALGEMLSRMLIYWPNMRTTATEAVESRWMKDWGWKAMEEMGLLSLVKPE